MQRLYTEIVGMPVLEEGNSSHLGMVRGIVIDPDNGKIIAFHMSKRRIIVPMDIVRIGSALFIQSGEHILSEEDVYRVEEVRNGKIQILGSRVFGQETGSFLGRVVDYAIDLKSMKLASLHVAKLFLLFRYNPKIIASARIIEIFADKIIVKELDASKVKERQAMVEA